MSEFIEKYDPEKVELIRMKLENAAKSGKPEFYEIYVDEMPVVRRTGDISLFDNYKAFTTKGSFKLSFRLYGTAPKGWRHVARTFVNEEPKNDNTLSGLGMTEAIKYHVGLAEERWETKQLKKDYEALKEQLREANEFNDKLLDKIEEIRKEKGDVTKQWGELASVVVEGIIRRNAHRLEKIPGLGEVTKIFIPNEDFTADNNNTYTEGEATFRKKSPGENNSLTEEEKQYLLALKEMQERLDDVQLRLVMYILNAMMEETDNIAPVAELLNININS